MTDRIWDTDWQRRRLSRRSFLAGGVALVAAPSVPLIGQPRQTPRFAGPLRHAVSRRATPLGDDKALTRTAIAKVAGRKFFRRWAVDNLAIFQIYDNERTSMTK